MLLIKRLYILWCELCDLIKFWLPSIMKKGKYVMCENVQIKLDY